MLTHFFFVSRNNKKMRILFLQIADKINIGIDNDIVVHLKSCICHFILLQRVIQDAYLLKLLLHKKFFAENPTKRTFTLIVISFSSHDNIQVEYV